MAYLRRVAAVLRRLDISDLLAVAGYGAIAYGASFIHPALPPIVVGLVCLRIANWGR